MDSLIIRRPDDMHCHLRQGQMLENVARHTAIVFGHAVAMTNLDPWVTTGMGKVWYRSEILRSTYPFNPVFDPIVPIMFDANSTPAMIDEAWSCRVKVAKLMPQGVSTNSAGGVSDFHVLWPAFGRMEYHGMILSGHFVLPGVHPLEGERACLPHLEEIVRSFPRLKVVVEHVTTAAGVNFVEQAGPLVVGTITSHHPYLTWRDVYEDDRETIKNPHNYCQPVANTEADRLAVRWAMVNSPKFFFGSDSAPHLRSAKECAKPAAGVFTTGRAAISRVTQIFKEENALGSLQGFTSERGAQFYRLPPNLEKIELVKRDWQEPEEIDGIVPFKAGETLSWTVMPV